MAVVEDDLALPVLDAIRACLCTELESTPGGEVCFCGLWPGATVSADNCSCKQGGACGQAWVRLVRIYPWSTWPQQDFTAGCKGGLAAVVELGVIRCMPTGGPQSPPTVLEQFTATQTQLGDWQAMRRVLACCEYLSNRSVVVGAYEPRSQGGCGGGTLQATVKLGRMG